VIEIAGVDPGTYEGFGLPAKRTGLVGVSLTGVDKSMLRVSFQIVEFSGKDTIAKHRKTAK